MNLTRLRTNRMIRGFQSLGLVVLMSLLLGGVGFFIGGLFLALVAVGSTILLFFINPYLSPLWVLKLQRARRLKRWEAPQLQAQTALLAQRAELDAVPLLFVYPGRLMNAFTVGSGRQAAIAFSDVMLQRLSTNEIAGVLAHEISHIRNKDVRLMGFANIMGRLTHLLAVFGQFMVLFSLPLIIFGETRLSWMGVLLLIVAPTISYGIQMALSRTREYTADLEAAGLLGDMNSLMSALRNMDHYNQHHLRRQWWPFYPKNSEDRLLRSHPPTRLRLQRLAALQDPGIDSFSPAGSRLSNAARDMRIVPAWFRENDAIFQHRQKPWLFVTRFE